MFTICLVLAFLPSLSERNASNAINRPAFDDGAYSADQLAHTLTRHHDSLTAVSLVYISVPESRKGQPKGAYWRRAISICGTGLFMSDNSHGHQRRPWQHDPSRKTLVITPSESTLLENLNRSVVILNDDTSGAPDSIQEENFFDVLCWWPFVDWPPPQRHGHAYSMRTLLNEKTYRLRPEKQLVGSRPCFAFVVNDFLTVWCDCDRPACVLKSERYDPATKEIIARIEMRDYEEVGENIWLPKEFQIVRFDSRAHTPQLRKKVVFDSTFLVRDIKINKDVDASIFRQKYAPGTVRVSRSKEEIQYEPIADGQLEHFTSILKWCRLVAFETTEVKHLRWNECLLAFAPSFLLGCSLVVAVVRFRRIAEV